MQVMRPLFNNDNLERYRRDCKVDLSIAQQERRLNKLEAYLNIHWDKEEEAYFKRQKIEANEVVDEQ